MAELVPDFKEYSNPDISFEVLMGKTIESIITNQSKDEMLFKCADGTKYLMYHSQDCCESVSIDDIVGDLGDVLSSPITMAEKVSNSDDPPKPDSDDSHTWTFYKLGTAKGSVTIRWYGSSNGYYSESVDFSEVK